MDAEARSIVLLDAPSNLGLMPLQPGHEPGVRFAPAALRGVGIQALLGAKDGGQVTPAPYRFERPADSNVRNLDGLRRYAFALADEVGRVVEANAFPVVLGGDCSILLGPMLALRRRGRFGLVYLDGHTDVQTPEISASGGAAGMDLAMVTGSGPAALVDFDGLVPLVRDEDVVAIGFRDGSERTMLAVSELAGAGATFLPLDEARQRGLSDVATETTARFAGAGVDGFWIHVDVDVLDSELMPAVDSPQPDGMTYEELGEVLRLLLASPMAMGIEVTIFDPELDPDSRLARRLAETLSGAFSASTGGS
jgi:arginase